jgi:hypothetical protein
MKNKLRTVLEQSGLHKYNAAIVRTINLINFIYCQMLPSAGHMTSAFKKSVGIQILFPIVNVYGYKSEM